MYRALAVFALLFAVAPVVPAQSGGFDDTRTFVGQVQNHLSRANDLAHSDKEKERVANAQRHLSTFDKALSRNKFDKDALDDAIKDVQNVLDHNTLAPDDRDTLRADVQDLRGIRERRGAR